MVDETKMLVTRAPATMTVEEVTTADATDGPQRGRRHLDGSPPGEGSYLTGVTVSLPESDVAALEEIGGGNRSAAVRLLLDAWRERDEPPDDGQREVERDRPARPRSSGHLDPAAATP